MKLEDYLYSPKKTSSFRVCDSPEELGAVIRINKAMECTRRVYSSKMEMSYKKSIVLHYTH